MIKYFSVTLKKIVTTFYRLILVESCTAEGLFEAVVRQLRQDEVKVHNLIGIGADGANVMVGSNHSFSTLFKALVPDVVIVKCICHSLHLAAEYACKQLPKQLEFLVREVHNYFSHSPKRALEYQKLYSSLKGESPKKVPKLAGTRWLACYSAIVTILDQWSELHEFFVKAKCEDKCYTAEQLLNIMNCPAYKAYLVFLKYILNDVCKVNTMFQSDNVNPLHLFQDLILLFKNTLKKIVVPDQLQKVPESQLISFDFEKYVMHTGCMCFGYDFELISPKIISVDLNDVKEKCKQFLIKLCK